MKKKVWVQIGICCVISLCALCGANTTNTKVAGYFDKVSAMVMKEVTMEDVKAVWNQLTVALADAPAKVVSAVTEVNEASKYGQPIDEKSSNRIRQVHAVAGGMVLKSGINEKYGMYVQIKHEDAISTYGNLSSVGVVESERIQRGEIIGSYDSFSEDDFYYELEENL